jgi:hypothetical protein
MYVKPARLGPVPVGLDPAIREGAGERYVWLLLEGNYSQLAREQITRYAATEGTLEGCEWLEPQDLDAATEAFIAGMPAIDFDNPVWGSTEDLDNLDLPPVRGGSPEADPGRLDGDVADFESWLDSLDAGYPPSDRDEDVGATRAWYDAHHLAELNDSVRND